MPEPLPQHPIEPLDALAVGPHPDDVELFCGGLVANLTHAGHRVGILDLTAGEMASRGTPAERAVEATQAAAVLGAAGRWQVGLPDAGLLPHHNEQAQPLALWLRILRPELLIGPWQRDRHPDHSAAGQLLERAAFLAGLRRFAPEHPPWVPRQVWSYPMRIELAPTAVVDISASFATKQAAIACHRSQVAPASQPGAVTSSIPTPLIASPASARALQTRDAYWGAMIGADYGEPYLCASPLAVRDPLTHLRTLDLGPAQLFPARSGA